MGTEWGASKEQEWVWGTLHIQALVEPTNQLHSPAGIWGHTHNMRADTLKSSQIYPSRITSTPINPSHTIICLYTSTHTPPWIQTQTKPTKQADLIHTNAHTGARQTPPTLGHWGTLQKEGRDPTMQMWPQPATQKRTPRGEKTGTPKKIASSLTHTLTHPHTPPTPAQPTLDLRCYLQLQGPPSGGCRVSPHCYPSQRGDPHYAPSFHLRLKAIFPGCLGSLL